MSNLDYEVSSGNVYEDMGYEDSVEMKMKAQAIRVLSDYIEASGMTQKEAAEVLGIDQPKISKILRGQFHSLSMEKVFGLLIALGKDINITVKEKEESLGHLRMHVA